MNYTDTTEYAMNNTDAAEMTPQPGEISLRAMEGVPTEVYILTAALFLFIGALLLWGCCSKCKKRDQRPYRFNKSDLNVPNSHETRMQLPTSWEDDSL